MIHFWKPVLVAWMTPRWTTTLAEISRLWAKLHNVVESTMELWKSQGIICFCRLNTQVHGANLPTWAKLDSRCVEYARFDPSTLLDPSEVSPDFRPRTCASQLRLHVLPISIFQVLAQLSCSFQVSFHLEKGRVWQLSELRTRSFAIFRNDQPSTGRYLPQQTWAMLLTKTVISDGATSDPVGAGWGRLGARANSALGPDQHEMLWNIWDWKICYAKIKMGVHS